VCGYGRAFSPIAPSYLFVIDAMKKILSKTKKIPKDKQWSFGNLFFSGTNIAYNSSYESGEIPVLVFLVILVLP
jgi:hypothetical protein